MVLFLKWCWSCSLCGRGLHSSCCVVVHRPAMAFNAYRPWCLLLHHTHPAHITGPSCVGMNVVAAVVWWCISLCHAERVSAGRCQEAEAVGWVLLLRRARLHPPLCRRLLCHPTSCTVEPWCGVEGSFCVDVQMPPSRNRSASWRHGMYPGKSRGLLYCTVSRVCRTPRCVL